MSDRRVKIVATIGPKTRTPQALRKLVEAGMNVARLNFSHSTHEEHKQVIESIRKISIELRTPVAILQDLQGPKIRVGKMKDGFMELKPGENVILSREAVLGEHGIIPTEYKNLDKDCRPGMKLLLDDGLLELKAFKIEPGKVHCKVIYGGPLKDNKGMNIPGANLSVDCLTEKDLRDLEFGLKQGVDYVALSFVRRGEDIRRLRGLVEAENPGVRIVAKIEMLEALDHLEEIARLSDAVMVARGDMAVEVGQSLLPGYQKEIIRLCNELGKPVITATQMLDSMVTHPTPTRAEITDIANAVLDGSDALMLSAETASGQYPVKCIQTMDEIIRAVEKTGKYFYHITFSEEYLGIAEAIAASACLSAKTLNASVIVCLTTSGKTASLISKYRPKAKIIAVTHLVHTLNRLELVWGIQTLVIDPYDSTDSAIHQIEELLIRFGLAKSGDKVILTMGTPILERGTTNSLRVYVIRGGGLVRLPQEELPVRFQ